MRSLGWVLALVPMVLMGGAAAPLKTADPLDDEPNFTRICEVRLDGKVAFHGACLRKWGVDAQHRWTNVITAGGRSYRFVEVRRHEDAEFSFNGRDFTPRADILFSDQPGVSADQSTDHQLYTVPASKLTVEVAPTEIAFGPDRYGLIDTEAKRKICEVRRSGRVIFHGVCGDESGTDRTNLKREVKVVVTGHQAYRVLPRLAIEHGRRFRFNGNMVQIGEHLIIDGRPGFMAYSEEDLHEVYIVPGVKLSIEEADAEDAIGHQPNRTLVSGGTGKRERIGQCFETTVAWTGRRLDDPNGPIPGSGSNMRFADGHTAVSYQEVPAMNRSKLGDPVRLCVKNLPRNCPENDTRGILYTGFNRRTGGRWTATDAEHGCGGA